MEPTWLECQMKWKSNWIWLMKDVYLKRSRISLKFNPPRASYHEGVIERMIRSICAVLNGMNVNYRMDSATLQTILSEDANIVNNKPLTGTIIGDSNEGVITPNILLTVKSSLPHHHQEPSLKRICIEGSVGLLPRQSQCNSSTLSNISNSTCCFLTQIHVRCNCLEYFLFVKKQFSLV